MTKHAALALAFAFTTTFAVTAHAAPSKADQLFQEGRKLVNDGDYPGACKKFEESRALDPAASTVLNLGLCNEKQGKYIEAVEHFKNAALAFGKGAGRVEAEKRAAEAEKMVSKLVVKKAPTLPADARISVDGNAVREEALGEPMSVNPGVVEIAVDAEGRQRSVKSVKLEPGTTEEVVAEAGAELTGPAGEPLTKGGTPPAPSKPSPLRTAGFIVGGVGVASLIVGGVTGLLALSNAGIYRDRCVTDGITNADGSKSDACTPSGLDASKRLDLLEPLSTITFIAGGVLAAGGLTMILIAPKVGNKSPSRGKLQITPAVGPTAMGASLAYTFQ